LRVGRIELGERVTAEHAAYASEQATVLFAYYRKVDADVPSAFIDAAIAILADYPRDVIEEVTCPRRGIPTMEFEDQRTGKHYRLKWPPQPSEIKDACEKLMVPRRRKAEREGRDARVRAQLAERAAYDAEEAQRSRRLTGVELRAKYGGLTWGIGPLPPHSIPVEDAHG
jgi:hypothetical protein